MLRLSSSPSNREAASSVWRVGLWFACSAMFLVLGVYGSRAYVRREASRAEVALTSARQATADVTQRLRVVESERNALEAQRLSATAAVDAPPSPADDESRLRRLRSAMDDLQMRLVPELKTAAAALELNATNVTLVLDEKLLFDGAHPARLSASGRKLLERLAPAFARGGDKRFDILSHADGVMLVGRATSDGSGFETGWELASARSVSVVRFLSERAQVPPHALRVGAQSRSVPSDAPAPASARRVEIVVSLGPLPVDVPLPEVAPVLSERRTNKRTSKAPPVRASRR